MRVLLIAALLAPCVAAAQPTKTKTVTKTVPGVITQAILPDYAARTMGPGAIVESYTEDNPCTPHTHERVFYISAWRRMGSFPNPTAVLYRDGVQVESWTIGGTGTNTTVNLGKFTWTMYHECPTPGQISQGPPPPPPNYRLVVDPAGLVTEQSEQNNSISFYMDPSRTFTKLP